MRIFLTEQKKNLSRHLDYLIGIPVMVYDKNRLTEKVTTIAIDRKMDGLDLQFFFQYKIFPDNIMTCLTQWDAENRTIKIGDTIVQQVYLPPTKTFSQKVILGVRINETFDTPYRKGFSYETLVGHVETGVSTFTIERSDRQTIFKIHTFSAPGNILTKLIGPIFSVPYQTFCTRQALKNVKRQIEI